MTRSRLARLVGYGAASLVLVLALGCGGPPTVSPTLSSPSNTSSPGAPGVAPVAPLPNPTKALLLAARDYKTYANRGISGWKATLGSDKTSLSCGFRTTSGDSTHYGGVALPVPGTQAFRVSVEFAKGASAVRAIFVNAAGKSGDSYSRWGYDVAKSGQRLHDGETYSWVFAKNRAPSAHFWVIPGKAAEHSLVHFFVDVDPDQQVEFTIARVEM